MDHTMIMATAAAGGAVAVGTGVAGASKDLTLKLLGPLFEYVGDRLVGTVKNRDLNVSRVLSKALDRLGEDALNEPGAVNPRVFKEVWEQAQFVENELAAEYFGGLLAASRNADGTDDRTLPFVKLVSDMSVIQIRMHYLAYYSLAWLRQTEDRDESESGPKKVVLPLEEVAPLMADTASGFRKSDAGHALFGLSRMGLIGGGSHSVYRSECEGEIHIEPKYTGAELFLRVYGRPEMDPTEFITGHRLFSGDPLVPPCPSARLVPASEPVTHEDVDAAIREYEFRRDAGLQAPRADYGFHPLDRRSRGD